ncbi:MAG: archaemetzincin family Zn-dependent metalloprotease [Dehalococcoidia bacterium]|jgi:archaemetzincin
MEIDLQPVGTIGDNILQDLKQGLQKTFGCPVKINKALSVPASSYDSQRDQYLSDAFIELLKGSRHGHNPVLAVTDVNLYTSGLNFVFGQASEEEGAAVISLNLLRQENYGLPADPQLLAERTLKEAVHELGHTFGMGHCANGNCVMHFSNSLIDTDIKKAFFCGRCRPQLKL